MTGKELKDWAATVHDEAVISARWTYDYRFSSITALRAELVKEWAVKEEERAA